MTAERLLIWLLRGNAGLLLLAIPCALLPFAWMDAVHRDALGLGQFPDIPMTKYMARSLSLVYAGHGAIVLLVTLQWERYRPAVPFLAWLHVIFGAAMLPIDLDAAMPLWWTVVEGPGLIGYGFLVLTVYRRANARRDGVEG